MKRLLNSVLLLILISGCSSAGEQHSRFSFESADPSETGLYADSLEAVTGFLQAAVDSNKIPGAVAMIVKDSALVYNQSVGMADIEQGEQMESDHIFRLASMTKPVTTVAALMLAERDSLNVNDPVSDYIPEFADVRVLEKMDMTDSTWTSEPVSTPLTIHHLLTHTSGIAYGFIDEQLGAVYTKGSVPDGTVMDGRTIEETMASLGRLPLKHEPGAGWTYGLSSDLLGRVVEVASGMPLDRFFQDEIFEPLGMDSTGFNIVQNQQGDIVTMYRNDAPKSLARSEQLSVEGSDTLDLREGLPEIRYFSGGSGLLGTAEDYQVFLQTILNGGSFGDTRLFEEQTASWMMENQIGDLRLGEDGFSYGFRLTLPGGDMTNMREPGRLQWGGLFQTHFWIDPARNSTVVLMTQVFPSGYQQELYNVFEQRVNSSYR
jgi:CubicO group peptidase (beta-lactamase class C family)